MSKQNNNHNNHSNDFKSLSFFVPIILTVAFSLCILLLPASIQAKQPSENIIIVYQNSQSFSQQLISHLKKNIASRGYHVSTFILTPHKNQEKLTLLKNTKHKLLIAIGSQTTETLLKANINSPILSALIPRYVYKTLQLQYKNKKNWSSLLINQPLDRQFYLISAVLGKHKKTAVILGPNTKDLNQSLNKAAKKTSHSISIQKIKNSKQLPKTLDSLQKNIDVILTIPDPVVYNKNTLRNILLSSYRNRLPLIGFSQSYVRAGAIAAIYSKPKQISHQITSIMKTFFTHGYFKKNIYYPDDFSVALNKNIARSLGIKLASNRAIIKHIKKAEKKQ